MAKPQTTSDLLSSFSPAQRDQILAEAMREVKRRETKPKPAKMTFSEFKHRFWLGYKPAPYDAAIDEVLQGIADYILTEGKRGTEKAMLFLPPRAGKTIRVRLFCAWMLTQRPGLQIISASYGMRLAEKNTRWVRNLLLRRDFQDAFPQLRLLGQASDQWETTDEGGLTAAAVGSSIVGFGCQLAIIDDPTKSRAEAESQFMREKVKSWYADDLLTRVEYGGAQLLIGSRYHVDDLPGSLLAGDEDEDEGELPDTWRVLSLPAIAEKNDALGREPGQALWPERYPLTWLEKRRKKMGEYSWSALYMQTPVPSAGGVFKFEWFNPPLDLAPVQLQRVRYWDLAMSEKTSADYTVGLMMGIDAQGHYYILDVIRKRVDIAQLPSFMAIVILADGPEVKQGIENKGYMSRAIRDLNRDPRLVRHQIRGYPAEGDKLTRALPFAAKCEAGLVHVMNKFWRIEYVDELCSYPFAAHDDQLDASSGAYEMISGPLLKKLTVEVLRYA